jgi:hypothetical protein
MMELEESKHTKPVGKLEDKSYRIVFLVPSPLLIPDTIQLLHTSSQTAIA